jgi:hypothetical protein
MQDNGNIIGELPKNSLEKVVVQVKGFNGKVYVDARIFWRDVPTSQDWHPSKKGICVALDKAGELAALIGKAASYADA